MNSMSQLEKADESHFEFAEQQQAAANRDLEAKELQHLTAGTSITRPAASRKMSRDRSQDLQHHAWCQGISHKTRNTM